MPRRALRRIISGRPFPIQICFADFRGLLHRPIRDRLEGVTTAVDNTDGGTNLQKFGAEVAGVR